MILTRTAASCGFPRRQEKAARRMQSDCGLRLVFACVIFSYARHLPYSQIESDSAMHLQQAQEKQAIPSSANMPWYKKLGPGLITGAADDDPSGIATYSQGGAQFGYNMLWTLFFTYPLMVGIQIVSARIGRVTGSGLAGKIRSNYSPLLLYSIVCMLLIAITFNIAADIAAMADAVRLIIGGPQALYAAGFGSISVLLQVFIPYRRYVRVLKWLTLALFAYVAVAFTVHIDWKQVAHALLAPKISFGNDYVPTVVTKFGTTISPYLFFWQAAQEVEEVDADPQAHSKHTAPQQARQTKQRIKVDT